MRSGGGVTRGKGEGGAKVIERATHTCFSWKSNGRQCLERPPTRHGQPPPPQPAVAAPSPPPPDKSLPVALGLEKHWMRLYCRTKRVSMRAFSSRRSRVVSASSTLVRT